MYLKRLEIHGFKSFASRTPFEFGRGITCIIGPNGVGKSNVADAIRWVLGEHSSRTIRARRIEEIIFSGSSQKSAVGMAEVSLVLDNSDGSLPIDFSEVVVTRRAYRDGQSEYLLNRNRVRLKEIQDVFSQTQVAHGGYAFMGQGLVEEVLALRPEERRALVEEAADVRRYRIKLDEARHRLAATRDNLDRVNLLIGEIGPTLSRLERQAERAGMYARLARELSQALRAWYGHLWHEGQDSLTAAMATLDQRQEESRRAEGQIATYEEEIQALRTAIEERRRSIEERSAAEKALADDIVRLEHQCALDEERRRLLSERCQELRTDIESAEGERKRHSAGAAGADERQAELDETMEHHLAELLAHRQELAQAERDRAEARRQVVEAEEEALRAETMLKETEARLERARRTLGGLEEEAADVKGRRRELLRRLASLAEGYRAYHDDRQRLERELQGVADGQAASNSQVAAARAAIMKAEESVPQLQAQLERAQARFDILSRVQAQHEGFDAAVRMLLVAGGIIPPDESHEESYPAPGSLFGIVGIVARLVRVAPGMERAIEAALAENLQAIVLENYSDALAVIELLEEYRNGRVTMFPLDNLKVARPLVLLKEKGILGVASDLVSCEARFRPLIETLLGRTTVVENLALAQRVVKRGMGNVVTLDGEMLRPSGSLTSGTARSVGDLVGRESELQRLPDEIAALESAVRGAQSEVARHRDVIRECEASLAAQAERQQRLWQERSELEKSLVEYQGRLALLSGQMRELRHEETRARGAEHQLAGECKELEKERDALLGRAKAAEEAAEQHRATVAALGERLPALTEAVTQASVALAAIEGEREALVMRREEQETALGRLEAQIDRKRAQLTEAEGSLEQVQSRLQSAQVVLEERREEREALAPVEVPGAEEIAELESRERAIRAEIEAAQRRRMEAERFLLEAQSEVKLKNDELAALRETMEAEGFTPGAMGDVVLIDGGGSDVPSWLSGGPEPAGGPDARLPPVQGGTSIDPVALKEQIAQLRGRLRSLGPVDAQAPADYAESKERYDFLCGQVRDLTDAEQSLQVAIVELEEKIRDRFASTFEEVNGQFQRYFATFFQGGSARLVLTQEKETEEPGIEIVAQPPGKRVASLSMLSGGERALTAISLLFALLQTRPSPFCVLDEVDAMLDESNVGRFVDAVRKLSDNSQFIVITHNRRTIETADHIYGVSMGRDSTSSVLSMRLADVVASN